MPARALDLRLYSELPAEPSPLDLGALFTDCATSPSAERMQIQVEIGCGKGAFLVRASLANPSVRYVGIEWAAKYARFTADRLGRYGVSNARVLRADAGDVVRQRLPDSHIAALHLYHPDPWPKSRHHKRRLVQHSFIQHAARIMQPDAVWRIQTDHDDYFAWIAWHLDQPSARHWFEPVPFELPMLVTLGPDGRVHEDDPAVLATNWQRKAAVRGAATHQLAVRRTYRPFCRQDMPPDGSDFPT